MIINIRTFFVLACQLCLAQLAFAASGPQPAPASTIIVQGTRIVIPVPKDFTDAAVAAPNMLKVAQAMTPPTNRFQLLLLSDADIKRGLAGSQMKWDDYFMAQTNMQAEGVRFDETEFASIRANVAKEQAMLVERVKAQSQEVMDGVVKKIAGEQAAGSISLKIGETRPLGVFLNVNDAVGVASLVNYAFKAKGETVQRPVLAAMVIANVKHKVVFFYTYRFYRNDTDIEKVERAAKQWVADISNANP